MSSKQNLLIILLIMQNIFIINMLPIVENNHPARGIAAPAALRHQHHHLHHNYKDASAVSEDTVFNYLMEFDYLPKSDIETGALRTEEQFKDAIRNLQRFGNIPITGEIDAPTRALIAKPRCGVGDSNQTTTFTSDNLRHGHRMKRFVLQGPKWDKTDLSWSLVNQSMQDAGKVRYMLKKALGVWESNSKLKFREVYSEDADIQVLFARRDHGDGYKFDGPGQILAHAFYPGSGRGGDAHFDSDENWLFDLNPEVDDQRTDFLGVAVHEFGHSLGLGHSSDENAIMFPWYKGYAQDNDELPEDDRTAIQELYGWRSKSWGPYKPPTIPRTTSTTTTTTTTTTRRPYVYHPQQQYPHQYHPQQQYPNDPRYNNGHHHHYYNTNNNNNDNRPYYPEYPVTPRTYYPDPTTRRTTTTTTTTTTTRRPYVRPRTEAAVTRSPVSKPRPTKNRKLKPDNCLTHYDAISMIRGELFIFRGHYLWRLGSHGLYPGYPTETRRLWLALPEKYSKIDAVLENRDRKIMFFIGKLYYVFDSVSLVRGYPQPLTSLGLPSSLSHIDAAFVWGHNNRTYLFSGTLYWRLDDDTGRVELDYPRDLSIWAGIGYNIDAAFQYTNHKTYFFKDRGYWEFNDDLMRVAHAKAKLSARRWMNCPRGVNEVDDDASWNAPLISDHNETNTENAAKSSISRSSQSIAGSCALAFIIGWFYNFIWR